MPDDESRQQGWEQGRGQGRGQGGDEPGEPGAPHGASPAPQAPATGDPWSSPSSAGPSSPTEGDPQGDTTFLPTSDPSSGSHDPYAGPPGPYGPPPGQPPQGYGPPPPPGYAPPPGLGSPGPYGQPPAPGYGAPAGYGYAGPRTSTAATVVVVCGVASLVLLFTCLGFIPAIVALVKAGPAKREILASNGRLTGLGMVTAGRITSWVTIALTVIGIILLVLLISVGGSIGQDFDNGGFSAPGGV